MFFLCMYTLVTHPKIRFEECVVTDSSERILDFSSNKRKVPTTGCHLPEKTFLPNCKNGVDESIPSV